MPAYAEVPQHEGGEAPDSNTVARQKRIAGRNWVVIAVIALFAGLVLMSIGKDREALDAADATATQVEAKDIISNFGGKMDYFNKIANQEKSYTKKVRQEETAAKRAQQRAEKQRQKEMENVDDYTDDAGEDSANRKPLKKKPAQAPTMPPPTPAPTSKFTAPDETVYDFLYKHTDGSLIMHSVSVEEEESIPQNELNVITLTIQAMAAHSDDSLALAQVAVWFAKIAQAWPMDVDLSQNAVDSLELLIEMDLDNLETSSSFVQSLVDFEVTSGDEEGKVVFNTEGFKDLKEKHTSAVAGDDNAGAGDAAGDGDAAEIPETKEERFKESQIEKVVKGLLDAGEITGGKPVERLRTAVEAHETLEEWKKLLVFTLAVAEAKPVFQEYVKEWRGGKSIKPKLLMRPNLRADKKEEALENAADMLKLLEESCEKYPRVNDLLKAVFYEFLVKGPTEDDMDLDGEDGEDGDGDESDFDPDAEDDGNDSDGFP